MTWKQHLPENRPKAATVDDVGREGNEAAVFLNVPRNDRRSFQHDGVRSLLPPSRRTPDLYCVISERGRLEVTSYVAKPRLEVTGLLFSPDDSGARPPPPSGSADSSRDHRPPRDRRASRYRPGCPVRPPRSCAGCGA